MSEHAIIIGELPMDDLTLLEEEYQRGLKKLLTSRGIDADLYQGKGIRLIPGTERNYYVMAIEPDYPAPFPGEAELPYT